MELAKRGDVLLVDADIQTTAATWASDREEAEHQPPVPCVQKLGNIRASVLDLSKRYDYLVIDAAGRDSQELRTAMTCADVLLCPFRPSQADLDTAEGLSDIIDQARDFNESLRVAAVLTMCPTHHGNPEIQDSRDYLADFPTLPVLDCVVYDRKAYRDALSIGKGVTEHSDQKARAEITALTEALING